MLEIFQFQISLLNKVPPFQHTMKFVATEEAFVKALGSGFQLSATTEELGSSQLFTLDPTLSSPQCSPISPKVRKPMHIGPAQCQKDLALAFALCARQTLAAAESEEKGIEPK